MKIKKAFSTLGCPGWSFDEIFVAAKDLGMDGIEIRGLGKQMYAPALDIFSPENIEGTMEKMKRAGLRFSILTSDCDLSAKDWEKTRSEAKEYIDLAARLNVYNVRIMCESTPEPKKNIDLDVIAKRYGTICDYALDKKVYPLVETNGVLADSLVMAEFLKKTARENTGVLWDVHHPHRFFGESPYETAKRLEGFVRYVHVKDSVMQDAKVSYRMVGYGDVPILDCLKALCETEFDGFVSLEWVKRWCPDLLEPGIVLPHYANYMQGLQAQL